MKGIVVLFFIIFTLQSYCVKCEQQTATNESSANKNSINLKPVISSQTAIVIAKGYWCFDYELRNYDVTAIEQPDSWKVVFKYKEHNSYEGPIMFIDKFNGDRLDAIHSK